MQRYSLALALALVIMWVLIAAARGPQTAAQGVPPPFTSPAQYYSGISGPGSAVIGDGSGGWRSGREGVRYKGAHPKPGWQLECRLTSVPSLH